MAEDGGQRIEMNEDIVDSDDATVSCTIEVVSVEEAVVGGPLTWTVRVSCDPARDLRGATLGILDANDSVVADGIELVEFDGESNATAEFDLTAPVEPGTYTWAILLPKQEVQDVLVAEARSPSSFTVRLHAAHLVIWEVPAAIPVGQTFRIRVGMKCSGGCDPTGKGFDICDHDGTTIGSGIVGDEPWPGTAALHVAEVELEAPTTEGTFRWEARAHAWESELPHEGGSRTFSIQVVKTPDHIVTVEAIDRDKQVPLAGMHVILHPFRALTDERGLAELSVPRGAYLLHVSGHRYHPFRTDLEVAEDVAVKAELEWEVRPEKIR
jgi:hypothetical protein